jgi:membrane-associated phospholipid phosphatase
MKSRTLVGISVLIFVLAATLTALFGASLWDVAAVQGVQALGGWLKLPMRIFTFLGDEQFYLIAIPLVYWCIHKGLGADLGVLLVLSSFTNTGLKSLFKHSRPFWENAALKLSDAGSFSTPSGHAQTSAALFGQAAWFAADRRRGRLWAVLLGLLIALVALSRVYLGVHFPGDVLWGATVGLGLLALYTWLKPALLPRLKPLPIGAHVLLAFVAAAAMVGLSALLLAIPFGTGQLFGEMYIEAWGAALEDAATVAGLVVGLWVGLVLEARAVHFSVAGPWWQRTLRYVIGIVGLFAIWMGLRVIFPQEPLILGLALRVARYACAMLWAIVGWPWLFVRFGLGATTILAAQPGVA